MNIGMLWFDNDPKKPLADRIARAAAYYREKYGQAPDLCLVHPSMITGQPENGEALKAGGVEVRPMPVILPNHFWIGVHEKQEFEVEAAICKP